MPDVDPVERMRAAMHALYERAHMPHALRNHVLHSITESDRLDDSARRRRRRRGVAVVAVVGLVAAGSTTAAVLLNGQPSTPQFGVACRAGADVDADAVVIMSDDDPITACARLWQTGELPNIDDPATTGASIPSLTACVGSDGALEVFPDLEGCEQLSLDPAAPELSPGSQRIIDVQAGVSELNLQGCLTERAITRRLEDLFVGLDADRWTVRPLASAAPSGACVKGQVEPTAFEVVLFIL